MSSSWLSRAIAWWIDGDNAPEEAAPPVPAIDLVYEFFRGHDTSLYGSLGAGEAAPTDADLSQFERSVGVVLPEEFRTFSKTPMSGLYLFVREEHWPPAEANAVGPTWTFERGLRVFGISPVIPSEQDLRAQHHAFRSHSKGEFLPFLSVESRADRYCFDRRGNIYAWEHDTGEFEALDASFGDVLWWEMEELFERAERRRRESPRQPG